MYIKITDVAIECGDSSKDRNHDPNYCSECYVHYTSQLMPSFDAAASPQTYMIFNLQFTWKKQINEEQSTGVLGIYMHYASLDEFEPKNFHWLVQTVQKELHDDCNWDTVNI